MTFTEGETRRHDVENIASGNFGGLPPVPEQWGSFLSAEVPLVEAGDSERIKSLSTSEYIAHVHNLTRQVVESPNYHDPETGLISAESWKRLVDGGVLAASLDERDPETRMEEMMHISRMMSYYDIHLGLTIGITTALAIMPLKRFGSEEQQATYLTAIKEGKMYGLGITELNMSGSAALDMNSKYVIKEPDEKSEEGPTVILDFEKHLQGLSGKDGLIIAAVKADAPVKTIGLFVVDQEDIDTARTEMAGLSGIPYGINKGRLELDLDDHLMQELPRSRLGEFNDMFTMSRFMFPSMVLGHLERTEFEAEKFASEREIGKVTQAEMPVPRYILDKIKTRRIITEAIFDRITNFRTPEGDDLLVTDTTGFTMEANIAKTISTEYALLSAADKAELMGAAAFYAGSALQDYNDIWPFQIFEGSRRMLDTLIGRNFSRGLKDGNGMGDFFGQPGDGINMEEGLFEYVREMRGRTKSTVQQELLGQIALRCFALESLDPRKIDPAEFEKAKRMLNLEIKQIALEFYSLPASEV